MEADEVFESQLRALLADRRDWTLKTYGRFNSPVDDLMDWHTVAKSWPGAEADCVIYPSATLVGDVAIGAHSWVGPNCILDGSGGLVIGEYCSVGSGAQIFTHDTVRWALSGGESPPDVRSVSISDRCFVGSLSTILPGVHLGEMTVVSAGAVVTKSFPARSVVAGVPARRIGEVKGSGADVRLHIFD